VPQGFVKTGINIGFGDGSVRFVASSVKANMFWAAVTPKGGEQLGERGFP
jgi:prepilin-type processing-associated H-X9-DG protein